MKIKTEKEIKELRYKAAVAQSKYSNALEDYNQAKVLPVLRKMVGKCFKYRNTYGGGSEPWWLYVKVIDVDERGNNFTAVEFEYTSMNKAEVRVAKKFNFRSETFFSRGGYIEISQAEYNREKKKMLRFIEKQLSA